MVNIQMKNKDSNMLLCGNCPLGKTETKVGNGITEPPYLSLVRCPFETEYYKYPDDECNHEENRIRRIKKYTKEKRADE